MARIHKEKLRHLFLGKPAEKLSFDWPELQQPTVWNNKCEGPDEDDEIDELEQMMSEGETDVWPTPQDGPVEATLKRALGLYDGNYHSLDNLIAHIEHRYVDCVEAGFKPGSARLRAIVKLGEMARQYLASPYSGTLIALKIEEFVKGKESWFKKLKSLEPDADELNAEIEAAGDYPMGEMPLDVAINVMNAKVKLAEAKVNRTIRNRKAPELRIKPAPAPAKRKIILED